MKTRLLALLSLFLCLPVLAGEAGRESIVVSAEERELVMAEMREMLVSIQGITAALADEDMAAAAAAARASGRRMTGGMPPALRAKLPQDFKRQGQGIHRGFDQLAVSAEQGETTDMLLMRLGEQLNACVACHASYRLDVSPVQ